MEEQQVRDIAAEISAQQIAAHERKGILLSGIGLLGLSGILVLWSIL